MRAVVLIGLFVALVCVSETSGFSLDDLVARAEGARHPKPAKEEHHVPNAQMEEWSTDHLLGLDEPPPTHMFDDLVQRAQAAKKAKLQAAHKSVRKAVKHAGKAHRKHSAKKIHHKKAHKVHKRHGKVSKKHHTFAPHALTSKLFESRISKKHHAKKAHKAHHKTHKAHHKTRKSHKSHDSLLRLHLGNHIPRVPHPVQMISTNVAEPAMRNRHEAHSKRHAKHSKRHAKRSKHQAKRKTHKKHLLRRHTDRKEDSLLGLGALHLPHADMVVPEKHSKLSGLNLKHGHTAKTAALQGMASSMLRESDKAEKKKMAERAEKKKQEKKAAEEKKKREETLMKKRGGHYVHLDLSNDTPLDDDLDKDPKDDDELPSLGSFLESDYDDEDMDEY